MNKSDKANITGEKIATEHKRSTDLMEKAHSLLLILPEVIIIVGILSKLLWS